MSSIRYKMSSMNTVPPASLRTNKIRSLKKKKLSKYSKWYHIAKAPWANARNVHGKWKCEKRCFCLSTKIKKMSFGGIFILFFFDLVFRCIESMESLCIHRNIYGTPKNRPSKKSHNPTRWIRLMNTIKCYLKHGNSRAIEILLWKTTSIDFFRWHLYFVRYKHRIEAISHSSLSQYVLVNGKHFNFVAHIWAKSIFFWSRVLFFILFIYSAIYFQWLRVSLSYAENCPPMYWTNRR